VKLQTSNEKASRKETQPPEDTIEIRYIPLPPRKRAAWEQSMRILIALILEILEEEQSEIIERQF